MSLRSCPTLCDPIDGSPPGSAVPGILQARTLEWVAISFSSAWKWKGKVKPLSHVQLLVTPWTAAHQAPPSKGFSRQEYWSGLPLPSPIIWLHNHYSLFPWNFMCLKKNAFCTQIILNMGQYFEFFFKHEMMSVTYKEDNMFGLWLCECFL